MSPEQAAVVESQVAVLEPVRLAIEVSEEEVDGAGAEVVDEEDAATGAAAAEVVAGEVGTGSSLVGAAEDAGPTSEGEENGEDEVAAAAPVRGAWVVSATAAELDSGAGTTAGSLVAEVVTVGVIVVKVVVATAGAPVPVAS